MTRRELLQFGSAAALGLVAQARAADTKKRRVLYFTRSAGFEHSVVHRQADQPSHSERVLRELGLREGFEVEATKDGRIFDGSLDAYDVIAFYTTGDLTAATAKDGSAPMSAAGKRKLLDAIAAGKGFVGFHSAPDTFHSPDGAVDPYIAMLGAEFLTHGQQQEASLVLTSKFPGAGDMGVGEAIAFTDEWYAFRNVAPDLHVILLQETQLMKGDAYRRPDYPQTWARMHGKGRVFYTSLGHREDIWINPFFQTIALGGLAWASGRVNADVTPNIDKIAPKANQLKLG